MQVLTLAPPCFPGCALTTFQQGTLLLQLGNVFRISIINFCSCAPSLFRMGLLMGGGGDRFPGDPMSIDIDCCSVARLPQKLTGRAENSAPELRAGFARRAARSQLHGFGPLNLVWEIGSIPFFLPEGIRPRVCFSRGLAVPAQVRLVSFSGAVLQVES